MTTTLALHFLPTPTVLEDHLPGTLALDAWHNAACHSCGEELGQVQTLTTSWVDLGAIDAEISEMFYEHLMSDEARKECST